MNMTRFIALSALATVAIAHCSCQGAKVAAQRQRSELIAIGRVFGRFAMDDATIREKRRVTNIEDLSRFVETDEERRAIELLRTGGYTFIWGAGMDDMPAGPGKTVLAYASAAPEKGGYVLMGDTSVVLMTPEVFRAATKATGATPPSPTTNAKGSSETVAVQPASVPTSDNATVKPPEGWCTRCRGEGRFHCRECNDGLRYLCTTCGGSGMMTQIFGSGAAMRAHKMKCTSCYGVNRGVWCVCKGYGGKTCGDCNGFGHPLFKQSEDLLTSCKSLSVDFVIQRSSDSNPVPAKGSLFIADSDRVLVTRNADDGKSVATVMVSDGTRIRYYKADGPQRTPKGIGQLSKLVFSQGGFDLAYRWARFDAPLTGWSSRLSDWSELSNVKIGTVEMTSGGQVLPISYRLHVRNATPDSLEITV